MSEFHHAVSEIRTLDTLAGEDHFLNRLHPLVKLTTTILFIALVVSFGKYNLTGLLGMGLYLIVLYELGELSFREALHRLRLVLPLVCAVGLFNPFFDRSPLLTLGGIPITGGILSMLTLMCKGIFTVLASYALIATTSLEELCYSLRLLHVPKLFVTVLLLISRYLSLLLNEARRITQAYSLRAPGQSGIQIRAWGPLVGQLLLRSMDRAQNVYESMCLRGYHGEFYFGKKLRANAVDCACLAVSVIALVLLRTVPVFERIGSLFV